MEFSFIRDPREARDPRDLRDPRATAPVFPSDPRQGPVRVDPRQKNIGKSVSVFVTKKKNSFLLAPTHPPQNQMPPQPVRPPVQPTVVPQPPVVPGPPRPAPANSSPGIGPAGASDQEKVSFFLIYGME